MSNWKRILILDVAPRRWGPTGRAAVQVLLAAAVCCVVLTLAVMLVSPSTVYRSRGRYLVEGRWVFTPPVLSRRRFAAVVGASGLVGVVVGAGACWMCRRGEDDEA